MRKVNYLKRSAMLLVLISIFNACTPQSEKSFYAKSDSLQTIADDKQAKVKEDSLKLIWKKQNEKTIKELAPFFKTKKDEFESVKWYTPKDAPQFVNYNGIYFYFQVVDGVASNLRLAVQYAADDWLFWKQIKFSIDGNVYDYMPMKVNTDNGGGIWEWSDEQMTAIDQSLVVALSEAKNAKMKLIGSQYHKVKTITPKQLASLKRTYKLYQAFGGKLN